MTIWNKPDVLETWNLPKDQAKSYNLQEFGMLNQINWEALTCRKISKHFTLANFLYMLMNQTWVHLLTHSKANLSALDCGEGKVWHLLQGTKQGVQAASARRHPNSPMGFSKAFLKAWWGRGIPRCVISSGTILWLVDGEVTGWCHRG